MSLSWPDCRVRIALAPSHVAVADGRTCRESSVTLPGWPGALEALRALLTEGGWRGRAEITLSHHFAHVHCLPSPPVVLKPSEMQGWVRDFLERQFGEAARRWRLAWQDEVPGKPFVVGSIDASKLEELEECLRGSTLRPARIQPWLAAAWTRHQRSFGSGHAWYALAEPGRLVLAGVASGHIRSLRMARVQDAWAVSLANLLKREALLAGDAGPAPIWIDSVLVHSDWREAGFDQTVHTLARDGESIASMLGVECAR